MTHRTKPTYLDLFSGCGGVSLGFQAAGFRPLLAVDWDSTAVDCYNFNPQDDEHPGAVKADLSLIRSHEDVARFLAPYGIGPGDCDVLAGGPPCQSFSVVGRTKVRALMESDELRKKQWESITASRTMLFEAYALFLEYLAPRWFLFENVPAIRSHAVFEKIQHRFANLRTPSDVPLKYSLTSNNYWASDYGVPQQRRRFIMVGYQQNLGISSWQAPKHLPSVRVREAIGDLPKLQNGAKEHVVQYSGESLTPYQKRMREPKPDRDPAVVYNHVCRTHNPDDVALFGRMGPGARFSDPEVQTALRDINPEHKLIKYAVDKFQDKLHKLDPDRPAWTVTAHLQKDGYKFIHYEQPRTISVREAARLQSFPDWFVFPVSMGPAFRLIGNAVPPMMAQAFAASFRACDPELSDGTPVETPEGQLELV
jgi:DNA (cytosine-5)-methyltransferase 1